MIRATSLQLESPALVLSGQLYYYQYALSLTCPRVSSVVQDTQMEDACMLA